MTELTTVQTPSVETQIKRDQYGRYLLPHPDTGKQQAWTRATTIADTLEDRYNLENWAKRNVALGIGARKDLYAQAAAAKATDKQTLKQIVAQAEDAASAKAGANLGSALHRFTERLDAGEQVDVPEPWAADCKAYQLTMRGHGITVVPGWIERVLLIPQIDTAGTCDRLCEIAALTLPRIGDLKTGADIVKYGMTKIAVQEAIYAHATHWWDPVTGELHEMPPVDQEKALVMHLPVGQGTCTLYEVDIQAGWEAVQLAVDVRAWRARKDLACPLSTWEISREDPGAPSLTTDQPPDGEAEYLRFLDRLEWLRDRVQAIKDANYAVTLAQEWSKHPDIPTFPKGGPTNNHQIDTIAQVCNTVEMIHGLPFGPSDPTLSLPATKADLQ